MKRIAIILTLTISLAGAALASDKPSKAKPPSTPEAVEKGKVVYLKRCSFCHGLLGDGNGPAADYMDPRPRDFTMGTFKFRTTQSGELPTDEDLFRTISRGLSGTGMQAFDSDLIKNGLTEEERWQVIYYIKTFAAEFSNPDFDPYKKVVNQPSSKAAFSDETVAKGREVFERAKCWECHGKQGRGDGQKAFDRKDDWGFPIRIRNVTIPWKIKAGNEVEDIYMRFSTGVNGTPMPSFVDSMNEQERWYLANFIKSLQRKPSESMVLKAREIKGEVPDDPESQEWKDAEAMDVRMTGQVIAAPRWQNPSIEMVTLKAIYNDKEIAFLAEWDDPFKDATHQGDKEADTREITKQGAYNSYIQAVGMVPRQLETYRDSLALQFPVKLPEGAKRPHFFRGDASNPVNLWVWKADLDAQGGPSAEEATASGFQQPLKPQSPEELQVKAKSLWKEGRWMVAMKRPLVTADKKDVQFEKGKFIPVSLNAWDGSNGEHGLIMSLSSWHYVMLESSTPAKVYLYTVLGVVLAGIGEFWLVRKSNGIKGREQSQHMDPDRLDS